MCQQGSIGSFFVGQGSKCSILVGQGSIGSILVGQHVPIGSISVGLLSICIIFVG